MFRQPEWAGQAGQGRQAQWDGSVHGQRLQLGTLLLHEGPVWWITGVHEDRPQGANIPAELQLCQQGPAAATELTSSVSKTVARQCRDCSAGSCRRASSMPASTRPW